MELQEIQAAIERGIAAGIARVKEAEQPVTEGAKKVTTWSQDAWKGMKDFMAPVASLFTARTLWFAAALAGLGLLIGWNDIRLFGLSALWAVLGIVVAYHARKWLMPEVKLAEWYDLAKAGNVAAALVICGVLAVQCACILIVALSALKAGV